MFSMCNVQLFIGKHSYNFADYTVVVEDSSARHLLQKQIFDFVYLYISPSFWNYVSLMYTVFDVKGKRMN